MSTFDWSQYTGNLAWLPERTLFLTKHGSHAYGTSTPTSDLDIRGVAIAPVEYYHGYLQHFEQAVQTTPVDLTVFELRKFIGLAADANPNALELLFTDPSDHVHVTPIGEKLLANRELFLSQKALHTFSGYAKSQLLRINGHYRWLKSPPSAPPTRAEFGLPERTVIPADQLAAAQAAIRKQVDQWSWHGLEDLSPSMRVAIQTEFNDRLLAITKWQWADLDEKTWRAAALTIGIDTNFLRLLDLERQYTARLKDWQSYQKWQKERNPARAELEAKYSYDTKHASHLVRLLRMCQELLEKGIVQVKRPDAAELLEIRNGAWSYEQLIEFADREDARLREIAKTSPLPKQPDRARLDQLCIELVELTLS